MKIHVVQYGENLWLISQKYGAAINQIVSLNLLPSANKLLPGEALMIPEPSKEYVVSRGDTLYSIAQKTNSAFSELQRINQISNPDALFPGEFLILPSFSYTIQSGDNLWKISQKFGVPLQSLFEMNGLNQNSMLYAGQQIKIPALERPEAEVNAYTTSTTDSERQKVQQLAQYFTYLSPFTHAVTKEGTITTLGSKNDQVLIPAAKSNQAATLLVLTNFANGKFDSDLAAAILRDPALQDKLIGNILTELRKGYSGVNFDFEYVNPEDRDNYSAFLKKVVSKLHPEGFSVSTALAPKLKADQKGLLYEAHDYKAQGQIVDFIVLMTYEWGWAGGPPLAIAPINEVRKVLDYAVTVIPANKIMMGAPLYGRDWKIPWQKGTIARTISPIDARKLAVRYNVPINYNYTYESPYFRYTDESGQQHEVWFEDARSMKAKMDTVKIYQLRGISYWELANEFPQNWTVQRNAFRVKKIL
ncbi:LysM peptidoglycan-binding domain-containing protein [Falsibacillus pallidus]|uniref:Spore germination protein n=1 Tax=Falsibacillus pallidus TaxID=493781 RepID=A0A370GYY2_9BACI|nr:LysM peptidoglycan-binding domain-containing protein [Falsibacillus pallidus]RDI47854.1 spore germination protein [Falsibacillus pallidus]